MILALVAALAPAPSPQIAAADASDDAAAVNRFRRAHRRTQLVGMGVLTGWAVANIASGIAGAVLVENDTRYVHEMNALWNSVNLTLGIVGLVNNGRRGPKADSIAEARRVNRKTRRTYVINGGLDVLYIGAGALAAGLGGHYGQKRIEGWGKSIVFQGAWLFAFDLAMVLAHERVAARTLPPVHVAPLAGAGRYGVALTGAF
jgi:hypothetical protein